MSSTGGVNSSNLDNPNYILKPQQSAGGSDDVSFLFAAAPEENAQTDTFSSNEEDNNQVIDAEKNIIRMLESGTDIQTILDSYPNLAEYITSSIKIEQYFHGDNPEYKKFYDSINSGIEQKLSDLYSDKNMSISEISAKISENAESYPLDLSKNKNEILELIATIRKRYDKATSTAEKKEIITQLEMLTGINITKTLSAETLDGEIEIAFAVITSLTEKMLGNGNGMIINCENVTDSNEIVAYINEKIDEQIQLNNSGAKNKNISRIAIEFSGICSDKIVELANEEKISGSVNEAVSGNKIFALKLQARLQDIRNWLKEDNDKDLIDRIDAFLQIKIDSYLCIDEYIDDAVEIISIAEKQDFNVYDFKETLKKDKVKESQEAATLLIRLNKSHNLIKDDYDKLSLLSH